MEKIPGTASRVGPSEQSFERVAKDQQRRKDSVPNRKADVALSGYKTSIACMYADFRSREPEYGLGRWIGPKKGDRGKK